MIIFGRRKTFVVNRRLQLELLLTCLAYVVFLVFVVSAAMFVPLMIQLERPDPTSSANADAATQLLYLHKAYWLPALLAVLAIGLHSISTSHRIAGPLYRFRRVCEAMATGTVPRKVTLRQHDHLVEEMDAVNAMLDTWRQIGGRVREDTADLQRSLVEYQAARASADGRAAEAWAKVMQVEARLRDTADRIACDEGPSNGKPLKGTAGAQ